MNKKKPANQMVKDRLLSALVELSNEKECSRLTVTELIVKSGVARASFYRNFRTIEDIIDYGIQKLTLHYHQGKNFDDEDCHSREIMLYKFQFYRRYAGLVLAFHHAKMSTTLLELIVDCEIEAHGDMPANSITRYKLYYFSGAFYNVMINWLEDGARETPEEMADEFLRIAKQFQETDRNNRVGGI